MPADQPSSALDALPQDTGDDATTPAVMTDTSGGGMPGGGGLIGANATIATSPPDGATASDPAADARARTAGEDGAQEPHPSSL